MPHKVDAAWPAWSWAALAGVGTVDAAWLLASPLRLDAASTWTAATPVFGGHYFIDLIGGTLLAAAAALAVAALAPRLALLMPPALEAGRAQP